MDMVQKFKAIVRQNDFVAEGKSKDGMTAWFRQANSNMRLCIDIVTNSATVFWVPGPAQLGSKTFRTVTSLEDWFALSESSPDSRPNDRPATR